MKRLSIVLLATVFLVSCSGSPETTVNFKTIEDLITAFQVAGLPCSEYQVTPKEERELGQESAKEVGQCEIEGESVDVTIWKDSGQRKNWEGMGKSLGCSMGEAFGITEFDYLNGDTWTVSGTSKTLAEQLATKIGGKAIHFECP